MSEDLNNSGTFSEEELSTIQEDMQEDIQENVVVDVDPEVNDVETVTLDDIDWKDAEPFIFTTQNEDGSLPEGAEFSKEVTLDPIVIQFLPDEEPAVISSPEPVEPAVEPSLAYLDNGVLGSVRPEEPKTEPDTVSDKVLIHSSKSVSWSGVGNIIWGLNLVSKKQADQWLTRDHVRLATEEEASEFNK